MERLRQKRPRLVLATAAYDDLKGKVLGRDGWRCQVCGAMQTLEVHHIQARSKLGSDVLGNLITLCTTCHRRHHNNI